MFSKIRAAAHQRKSQWNGMLPIYINTSVLHKLQLNNAEFEAFGEDKRRINRKTLGYRRYGQNQKRG